jgi:DNA primase
MGLTISEHLENLPRPFKSIILFLNGDDAGRKAAKTIAGRLVHSHFVKVDLTAGREGA